MFKKSLLLTFVFVMVIGSNVYASETKNRVDISSGKILSSNGDFYFQVPLSWQDYIQVERVTDASRKYIERFDFIYEPRDEGNGKSKFLSFYSYPSSDWAIGSGESVLFTTPSYVFTVNSATYDDNFYETINDRIIYNRFISEVNSDDFIINCVIGVDPTARSSMNIYANGELLPNKAIKSDGVYYLPLRDICNKYGYSLTWNGDTRTVSVNGIEINSVGSSNSMYSSKIYNDMTYLPTYFYVSKLGLSIDIDNYGNVFMTNK